MEVDASALKALGAALGAEADGKKLRRDLAKEMRGALQPAAAAAKSSIMSMASSGLYSTGTPLRATIARGVKAEARLTGRSTGARVKATKKGMPREFANAPKRTNSAKGWRRRVFRSDTWVTQMGRPDWFDQPMEQSAPEARAAVVRAMGAAARRITRRV